MHYLIFLSKRIIIKINDVQKAWNLDDLLYLQIKVILINHCDENKQFNYF